MINAFQGTGTSPLLRLVGMSVASNGALFEALSEN